MKEHFVPQMFHINKAIRFVATSMAASRS